MAKLLIKPNGLPPREIDLKPGTNRFGRTDDNDFQIEDDSISSSHCELVLVDDGQIFVRDLGSTNGTFLNGDWISESYFRSGQTLHLGSVEIVHATDLVGFASRERITLRVAPKESSSSDSSIESENVPFGGQKSSLRVAPHEPSKASKSNLPSMRQFTRDYDQKSFFQQLPSTFSYPFKSNGLILLITGTLLFVVLDFVGQFSLLLAILAFGYLFLYMQRIVQYSAQGEEEMPGWPEISNWWDDILAPAFLLLITFVVSFGPVLAMWIFVEADPSIKTMLGISLAFFGCCYLPMALLAVSMYDSFFALNPLLIIPSIIRIPMEYMVACLMLGVVLIVRLVSLLVLDLLPIPLFPTVIGGFLSLYFLAVEMRILGVMYYTKRDELNWNI